VPNRIVFRGTVEMSQKLRRLAENFPRKTARAAETEFDVEKEESMRRTPKRTGALRRSHKRGEARITGKKIIVELSAGDETTPYAIHVHENLEAFHRVGQAKFLESTLFESRRSIGARIARRVEFDRSWVF
jgi:hypothetical protein